MVFPFGKLMLSRPVMGIGFNEIELKNNLIGYFKVTIFYSRLKFNCSKRNSCYTKNVFCFAVKILKK
jgi:hypothetical protein